MNIAKILILLLFVIPIITFAQSSNMGIINGLWFSQDTFLVDDPLRIYTAVQNNTGSDIQGTVTFFDNDILMGEKSFTALDGRIEEVWMDTVITEKEHRYSVNISSAQVNRPGESPQPITPRVTTITQRIVTDIDTDDDGIGDLEDEDDDNDGFTDEEEEQQGTDTKDSDSYPSDDDAAQEEDTNRIEEIVSGIQSLFTSTSEEPDDGVQEYDPDDRIEPPQYIQELEESYPLVQRVTEPITQFQNTVVPRITAEQERITKAPIPAGFPEEGEVIVEEEQVSAIGPLPSWVYVIYLGILQVLTWYLSSLVLVILSIFAIFYYILALLFRYVRNRRGYIRS
jgi:hypothetical protein